MPPKIKASGGFLLPEAFFMPPDDLIALQY